MNRMLFVGVALEGQSGALPGTTDVSFGGTTMTQIFQTNTDRASLSFWYMLDPTGTGDVVATKSGNIGAVAMQAFTLSGVDQLTPLGDVNSGAVEGALPNPVVSLTTQFADSLVFSALLSGGNASSYDLTDNNMDPVGDLDTIVEITSSGGDGVFLYSATGPGGGIGANFDAQWNGNNGTRVAVGAMEIKAAVVPEPSSLTLIGVGLLAGVMIRRALGTGWFSVFQKRSVAHAADRFFDMRTVGEFLVS